MVYIKTTRLFRIDFPQCANINFMTRDEYTRDAAAHDRINHIIIIIIMAIMHNIILF